MNNSTISAAVSMSSLQQRLDIIADNLANMDTNGYKSKKGSFEDVLTRVQQQSDDYDQPGRATPLGFNIGFGTYVPSITTNWEEGPLKKQVIQPTWRFRVMGCLEFRSMELQLIQDKVTFTLRLTPPMQRKWSL